MPCSQLRFLVVEDHDFQRSVVTRLLRTLGAAEVHSAADGAAALQALGEAGVTVDVVISDISMPGMDGVEFMRHLSGLAPGLPLIITSSLDDNMLASVGHVAKAYNMRLLGVLAKPATAAKLAPLLEGLRASRAAAPTPEARFNFTEVAEAFTHDEFVVRYEPQVGLANGAVRGMHATPRWKHPAHGMLEPAQFLPALRARGLLDDFCWLVLQQAFAHCRDWRLRGLAIEVSVSLGFESLSDPHLAKRLQQLAVDEAIDPAALVLLVRESALAALPAPALENLTRLRMMGFGLGVEDFGSGAMAIEPLQVLPFQVLKIKREFVANALRDKSAEAGLAVCLDVAHKRHLRTVGDGLATKEEWELLHHWGCGSGQGPFVSGALEAAAVPRWVAAWSGTTLRAPAGSGRPAAGAVPDILLAA